VAAQVSHAGLEAVARPEGLVVEDHEQGLVIQQVMFLARGALALQIEGHVQDGIDFLARVIEQCQKITFAKGISSHLRFSL